MASVYRLGDSFQHVDKYLSSKYRKFNILSRKDDMVALIIQKHFRGYRARKRMAQQQASAVKIQQYFRRWLVWYHLPDVMQEYYDRECLKIYNQMATRIQTLWRGHRTRKFELDFYEVLEQRKLVVQASELLHMKYQQAEELERTTFGIKKQIKFIERIQEILFDRHHLLGTYQKEGVLSNHQKGELSQLEKFLRCMTWKSYMKNLRKLYNNYLTHPDPPEYIFDSKELRSQEDMLREHNKDKRYEIADWIEKKEPMNLNTKIKEEPYERHITLTGKYEVLAADIVRTADRSKNVCVDDFDILSVWTKAATESGVPPYYIDNWYQKCTIHNLK